MTWANVDDLFPEHPKVIRAGGDAAWLYICGLCFTNRNLTEGRIPRAVVPRLSDRKNPMKLASVLVDVGLWHDKGDHFVINDWDKYNEDAETVKARKEQARKAAQARWAGKPKHAQGNADSNAGSNAQSIESAHAHSADEQCPPTPLPITSTRSSSNHHGVGPESDEEEEDSKVNDAARLVAERRLTTREGPPITNPSGWLRRVKAEVLNDHGTELRQLASEGFNAKAMADRIMPPPASPYPVYKPPEPDEPLARPSPDRVADLRGAMDRIGRTA